MNRRGPCGAAIAAVAMLLMPPPAMADTCWNYDAVDAARLREFQILVMSVSLRCTALGMDFDPAYERFLVTHSHSLSDADKALLAHFGGSAAEARSAYDHYSIHLANLYGVGKTDRESCATFSAIADDLAKPTASPDDLETAAIDMIRDPHLDGPRCAAGKAAQ